MDDVKLTTRGTRAGKAWVPVTRGAHRAADCDDEVLAGLRAWQAVLPEEARFTHLTGAGVHGLWLPPLPADLPIWVVLPYGVPRPDRPGLRVIRSTKLPPPVEIGGVRVDPVPRCIQRAARDLRELDLTCLVDAARFLGKTDAGELSGLADEPCPGVPRFRTALRWSDHRAQSIWEVMLRVLHVSCGIDVVPQYELWDNGVLVAQGDLWLCGTRVFHEYDGGDHLPRKQQRKDLKRVRRIDEPEWKRRGYTSPDVLHQAVTILKDSDRAIGREHDPGRIRPWHDLLRESLFTPAGTQLLRTRLRLDCPVGEKVS
jgi:hypothetical protein